jgi:hypothetical protein
MSKVEFFKKAFAGSYYTITGCAGELQEWKKGYQEILTREEVGEATDWTEFKGKDMNDVFGLTGTNAYPDDLTFLAFSLEKITSIGKLARIKLIMRDRWFDDIVTNDLHRQGRTPEEFGMVHRR